MDIEHLNNLLNAARLPESTVTVCLRGDLHAEWERLNDELTQLMISPSRKVAGDPREKELSRRIREIEDEMRASTLNITLRALSRQEWRRVVRDHPPREGVKEDQETGLDTEAFLESLLVKCIVSPEMTSEQISTLLGALSSAQYEKVTAAAWDVNRRDVSVPFSPIASPATGGTGARSRRPSDSESRRSASRAGSRKK